MKQTMQWAVEAVQVLQPHKGDVKYYIKCKRRREKHMCRTNEREVDCGVCD